MKSVIYKILNKANGKFYIGSAANWTINKGKFGHSNSKVIIQLDKDGNFLKRWNSSNEIYRETGYNHRNIRECCSGTKRKTAHGFKWKFENC